MLDFLILSLLALSLGQNGETALKVPENYTVTGVDVVNHPVIAAPAAGMSSFLVSSGFLPNCVEKATFLWHLCGTSNAPCTCGFMNAVGEKLL